MFISLEMPTDILVQRYVFTRCQATDEEIESQSFPDWKMKIINESLAELDGSNIDIVDSND